MTTAECAATVVKRHLRLIARKARQEFKPITSLVAVNGKVKVYTERGNND